jgi:hypothetical protein
MTYFWERYSNNINGHPLHLDHNGWCFRVHRFNTQKRTDKIWLQLALDPGDETEWLATSREIAIAALTAPGDKK